MKRGKNTKMNEIWSTNKIIRGKKRNLVTGESNATRLRKITRKQRPGDATEKANKTCRKTRKHKEAERGEITGKIKITNSKRRITSSISSNRIE